MFAEYPAAPAIPIFASTTTLRERFARLPQPAILEGGPAFGRAGRWSIFAAMPRLTFEAIGDHWRIESDSGSGGFREPSSGKGTLDALAQLCERWGLDPAATPIAADPLRPPFQGGLIGFVGYDVARLIESLPCRHERDSRIPDVLLSLYDTFVAVDHQSGSSFLWSFDLLNEGPSAARARSAAIERLLDEPLPPSPEPTSAADPGAAVANFRRAEYEAAVARALEYIRAGDIFQVNLSQRFSIPAERADPLEIYRRLRQISPAPYSALLQWGDCAVVSSSPELFYATQGREIVTRPIKGTRPRHADPVRDAGLAQELAQSEKDRAELTMIVDLERNDLGRICEYGSVKVVTPRAVESYAQVHHQVAEVTGRLRPGVRTVDIVRAMHPGGSITGAPKIRAMQIIDELERNQRGVYTGSIGFLGRDGASCFSIGIRTILIEPGRVSYQVGGGIVADSDPECEFQETLDKGLGMQKALLSGPGRES